jgi:hypothetical protein
MKIHGRFTKVNLCYQVVLHVQILTGEANALALPYMVVVSLASNNRVQNRLAANRLSVYVNAPFAIIGFLLY